jgi:hypothetical protein
MVCLKYAILSTFYKGNKLMTVMMMIIVSTNSLKPEDKRDSIIGIGRAAGQLLRVPLYKRR